MGEGGGGEEKGRKWEALAIIREISDSNLEIRFKIWSFPDHPGELAVLYVIVYFMEHQKNGACGYKISRSYIIVYTVVLAA